MEYFWNGIFFRTAVVTMLSTYIAFNIIDLLASGLLIAGTVKVCICCIQRGRTEVSAIHWRLLSTILWCAAYFLSFIHLDFYVKHSILHIEMISAYFGNPSIAPCQTKWPLCPCPSLTPIYYSNQWKSLKYFFYVFAISFHYQIKCDSYKNIQHLADLNNMLFIYFYGNENNFKWNFSITSTLSVVYKESKSSWSLYTYQNKMQFQLFIWWISL